nr:MAG TPA: hypothetical protein [Caudoviricetes sp.]
MILVRLPIPVLKQRLFLVYFREAPLIYSIRSILPSYQNLRKPYLAMV